MSVNSRQKTPQINKRKQILMKKHKKPRPTVINTSEWLLFAENRLDIAGITSARLDSEIIMSKVLNMPRTYIHSHLNKRLSKQQLFHANNWLKKREKRIPLAYIFGEKEFYGRVFKVSENVLVPRPETEVIIELYKKISQKNDVILDIGTGSGILAITSFLEQKNLNIDVFASDVSLKALEIAHNNADSLNANINFIQSDLLSEITQEIKDKTTVILANLPYVNIDWIDQNSTNELHYEPRNALYAGDMGLELIKKLIQQSENLKNLKFIIIEADPEQHQNIINFAKNYELKIKDQADYCLVLEKF